MTKATAWLVDNVGEMTTTGGKRGEGEQTEREREERSTRKGREMRRRRGF